MSDDFIPLNQSTPVQRKWQPARNQHNRFNQNQRYRNQQRGGHNNKWGNSPRNSSFGSNSSNNSFSQDNKGSSIDDYLHPAMLQDPWAQLRDSNQLNNSA